jgi:hypothetical protein
MKTIANKAPNNNCNSIRITGHSNLGNEISVEFLLDNVVLFAYWINCNFSIGESLTIMVSPDNEGKNLK